MHLPERDEFPHPIGTDVNWQESVFIWWRDVRRPIGGIFRMGHEPNKGRAPIWFGVRCVVGLVYLSRGEPHPRPYAVLA